MHASASPQKKSVRGFRARTDFKIGLEERTSSNRYEQQLKCHLGLNISLHCFYENYPITVL